MSRYGINFYGPGTYYGEIPLIEFDARPVTAQSKNYGEITIRWEPPSGDWDLLRLTRDSYGFAPRADMGTAVLEVAKATGATQTFTEAGLQDGKFYYYTVWVRATIDNQWRRAGDVIALVTFDHGYRQYMFELIPSIYRDKDMDTPQYRIYGRGQLERFMEIFGYEADHIRTEYETLKYVNDPQRCSGGLLPLMADQLGFGYENELGMRLARQQMKNAIYIYKHKGTQLGLEAVTSVLTGWAPTVTQGYNLALDQNMSAAAEGVGPWVNLANATVGRRSIIDASAPGVITGPVQQPPGASTGDVGSGGWYHLITAIGAGDMTVQTHPAGTLTDNRTYSIPVVGGLDYTLSVYSRAFDTVRSVQLGVEWFDKNGTSLGAVTWGTATANLTGAWTRHTYTVAAPANALFMRASIRVASAAAGNRIALGGFQVEQNATARDYQGARSVRIKFTAERVNMLPNASAEVNTTGWTATNNTLTRSTTQKRDGAASFQLVATAGGNMSIQSTTGTGGMPVLPSRFYTFSGYLFKAAGTIRQFRVDVTWYTAAGAVIGAAVQGVPVAQVLGAWTRASVTASSPANAAFAAVTYTVLAAGAAETQWIDSLLGEFGTVVGEFFDGTSYSNEGEYMWGATPGNSPSYYYSRRLIKNFRLNQRLPEFLPAGAAWALLYAEQT